MRRGLTLLLCALLLVSCGDRPSEMDVPQEPMTSEETASQEEEETLILEELDPDESLDEKEEISIPPTAEEQQSMLEDIRNMAEQHLSPYAGSYALYFSGCDWEEELKLNDYPMDPASTIKILLMVESMQQVHDGKLTMDSTVALAETNRATGCGEIQWQANGTEYTLEELLDRMMRISDNTAANMIIDMVGGVEYMYHRVMDMDLKNTLYGCKYWGPNIPLGIAYNKSSPGDLGPILKAIYNHCCVGEEEDEAMLALMKGNEMRNKIPALLPENITVYNKTGEIDGYEHDAAIIETPEHAYVLVIFMGGGDNGEFISRIQNFSLALTEYLLDYEHVGQSGVGANNN